MRARFLRAEGGFTLTEMLVTMLIWIVVLFALYSLFDMSVRLFGAGNNKVEAVESAREGLEKMEREIRAAYPVDANDSTKGYLFFNADGSTSNPPELMPAPTRITFGNDLGAAGNGNHKIECLDAANCEYITYKLTGTPAAGGGPPPACSAATVPCTLRRVNTANSNDPGDPVVENVTANGLNFTYLQSNGTTTTDPDLICTVRVSLTIRVSPGTAYDATQTLTTDIDLRNAQ